MSEAVFTQVNYDLRSLVEFIERGEIGLPDIQRPFVWKNVKVRDLFDSMYRGYPVGYLLFWQTAFAGDMRTIGINSKQKVPRLLIVDGQQRLTSLYAVIKNVPVVRDDYSAEHISIAFDPLLEKFEVTDAAIRRDRAFVPDISVLWQPEADLFEIVDDYLDARGDVSAAEKRQIRQAMSKLHNLLSFSFIALELASSVDDEQVAEVFVRINSKGTSLNQADFILTLMSVFWDEGRAQLEEFCRAARKPAEGHISPVNPFITPSPDQLLRVSVGYGFRRARLQHVYSILRGKDLETETFSEERREQQFAVLQQAQSEVLNLQHWHDFLKAIRQGGFRSGRMVSSGNSLLYTYVLYLIGRLDYGVDEYTLRRVIARWFFMASLTGRYTGSPESAMEFDLARFRDVKDADAYLRTLEQICEQTLTEDYWTVTLPNDLATSSYRSPSLFAYHAALVLLDTKALFSTQRVSDLLDPTIVAPGTGAERHHLFPRGYLRSMGITSSRDINQIGNYAFLERGDNVRISDQAPSEYMPLLKERVQGRELERMYYWHALPDNWESLTYNEFLIQRRELIARVTRDGYRLLCGNGDGDGQVHYAVGELISEGESEETEFKSTLRVNLHTGKNDPRIELSCLKTIAAFLNSKGGTLVIGVDDNGKPLGIKADGFPSEDRMSLHLVNLLTHRIGPEFMMYIHPHFEDLNGERVLVVRCTPSRSAAYVKDGNSVRFYVRVGPATAELDARQAVEYVSRRFA